LHSTYPATGYSENDLVISHSWSFSDATFHTDLAVTLKGAVDRL
jgi:hypothetical protein